jgi:hypothetical protein
MDFLVKTKSILLLACLIVLICFTVSAGYASTGGMPIQPETAQILLSMAGVETEIVEHTRGDRFDRTLYIGSLKGDAFTIGFPMSGVAEGVPFLLRVGGDEAIVALSKDGLIEIIGGDASVVPSSIIDAVECLLNTIVDLVRGILESGLNIFYMIALIVNAVFRILGCIASII